MSRLAGLVLAALAVGFALPAWAADPVPAARDPQVTKVTMLVTNLDRSLTIYRDALGLTLEFVKPIGPDSYSYEIFGIPRSQTMRYASLSAGSAQHRVLQLTEVPAAVLGPPPKIPLTATVLHAPNMDDALHKLAAIPGVKVLPEHRFTQPDGSWTREAAFIDPDGHPVLLYHTSADPN